MSAGPSGNTPILDLPFPLPDDTVDVPRDIQALATALDGSPGVAATLIADTLLGAAAAAIDFVNIPQTFAHLMALAATRSDRAAASDTLGARFNNDSGAMYNVQTLNVAGATATASTSLAQTSMFVGSMASATAAQATNPGVTALFIPGYRDTVFRKGCVMLNGALWDQTAAGIALLPRFGLWLAAPAAINRITFLPVAGGLNLVAGSRITLYGLRGT